MVLERPYRRMNQYESQVLQDLRDHEVAHREFLRNALGSNRIPDLQVNFSRVNFANRSSVLTTARTFEDLGVAAYKGQAGNLQGTPVLTTALQIHSVEARPAAEVRRVNG